MSVFSTTEINRRSKREEREFEKEKLRMEKRAYRDARWAIETIAVDVATWEELLTLHARHAKEGARETGAKLIPMWSAIQDHLGGAKIPDELWERHRVPTGERSSARRVRSDAGKARKK